MGRVPVAPKIEKSCQNCGKTWLAYETIDKRRFCSTACGAAGRVGVSRGKGVPRSGRPRSLARQTSPCAQCQKPFEMIVGTGKPEQKYCSKACYHLSRFGVPQPALRINPDTKLCERCGTAFLVGGEGRKARHHRYCSRVCAKSAYWESERASKWPLLPTAHGEAKHLTETEVAWLAGLFDGEGCIAWPRRENLHSVRIDIANTNEELLARVCEVTGTGRVQSAVRVKEHHTPAFVWHAYGDNARFLLHQMYPLLIIKRHAAGVALGFIAADEPPTSTRSKSLIRGGKSFGGPTAKQPEESPDAGVKLLI